MALYEYRCRGCGATRESRSHDDVRQCACGDVLRRDYSSVQIGATGLQPHFNHAVGQYVRSNREFNDALKRRAEENSVATGVDHSYARLDPGDAPEPPGGREAIETRNKTISDQRQGLRNVG